MPILNWIGKDKVVNHDKELPFRVLKQVKELSVGDTNENLLVEGDNLEALKALMPFYYNKVKCIYIDPPYNTGNEKWVYNDRVNAPQIKAWLNKVVGGEGEDLCRHDKWLCMMYPRLKLLHDLLRDDGVIFVSIDDNEQKHLILIMDEIFGDNNSLGVFIWKNKAGGGDDSTHLAKEHEYIVCYAKNKEKAELGRIEHESPAMTAKYNREEDGRRYYLERLDKTSLTYNASMDFEIICPDGTKIKPPQPNPQKPRTIWRWGKKTVEEKFDELIFERDKKTGEWRIYTKTWESLDGVTPRSLLVEQEHGRNRDGTREITEIFGVKDFPNPKPTKLIKHLLQIGAKDKDSIVLDSFVGSGTTGHAVLELNKEDGGNRKFILVELERDIAKKVTAKRLKKVIEGYEGAKFPKGTGQGFKYLDLNGELYDDSGFINPDAQYEDMAAYIYFTETGEYIDLASIKKPYIGSQGQNHYFLFFEGKGNNVLDEKSLKKIDGFSGMKIIYADKSLIDEYAFGKLGIIFKQIPYELKKY